MEKMLRVGCLVLMIFAFLAFEVSAANPGNGFPSGPHYNLNIIGKKAGFSCPEPELDLSGNPVYGNVVFVPENGKSIQLLMQSGKGAKAAAITELQATDACAGFDGDAAVIQLPKNDAGYRVFARALAKPTETPEIQIAPSLVMVQDEAGKDLVYLGLVTSSGFQTPYASFTRNKGKSTASDITGLFQWTGEVCYFSAPDGTYQTGEICCIDQDLNGIYEDCELPTIVSDITTCPTGYSLLPMYCKAYVNEWVFNIGDFVEYLWSLDNSGVKLLQVRFYPN